MRTGNRFVIELLLSLMLMVTSGDLLYLYFDGAWYDPNKVVEVSEVVCLIALVCFGAYYFVYKVRAMRGLGSRR